MKLVDTVKNQNVCDVYKLDSKSQKKSTFFDNNFTKPQEMCYNFKKWGWLGKQFLVQNIKLKNIMGLPSWRQIKDGILIEQILQNEIDFCNMENKEHRKLHLLHSCKMWYYLFKALMLPKEDSEEDLRPLTKHDLYDPESTTVKAIYSLYSMDSWIPCVINRAVIDYDAGKIDSIGPFACALSKSL